MEFKDAVSPPAALEEMPTLSECSKVFVPEIVAPVFTVAVVAGEPARMDSTVAAEPLVGVLPGYTFTVYES